MATTTVRRSTRPAGVQDAEVEPPLPLDEEVNDVFPATPTDDEEGRGYGSEEESKPKQQKVDAPRAEAPRAQAPAVQTTAPAPQQSQAAPPPAPVAAVATQPAPTPAPQPAPSKEVAVAAPQAAPQKNTSLALGAKGFDVENFDDLWKVSQIFARSTLVPQAYQQKPENVMIACLWGRELGLSPMASLTGIAVVNSTPSIWGDALPGLCYSAGVIEDHQEFYEGEGDNIVAVCKVKRKGQSQYHEERFSWQDAIAAGLHQKQTYKSYRKRMLMNRARGFAFRTKFADVLRGLPIAEEVADFAPQMIANSNEVNAPTFGRLDREQANG